MPDNKIPLDKRWNFELDSLTGNYGQDVPPEGVFHAGWYSDASRNADDFVRQAPAGAELDEVLSTLTVMGELEYVKTINGKPARAYRPIGKGINPIQV